MLFRYNLIGNGGGGGGGGIYTIIMQQYTCTRNLYS